MAQSDSSYSDTREAATSKWSDVIKNSKPITKEPIQTYMLNTFKKLKDDGPVRRCTFGRKDHKKRNRTILMVGETSTGKSTLINMMVNYMLGTKWGDNIRFEIIQDEEPQIKTQTTAITVYDIYGLEELSVPFSLTVIDTPGFGDPEKDVITAQHLCSLLAPENICHIDAVCLVVKASEYRLSPSQTYIFDAILSLFGKNIEKNIVPLITFSDWLPPSALQALTESGVPYPKNKNDEPVYFLFNNIPLKKFAKIHEEIYKTSWDKGTNSLAEFVRALDKMEPQSLWSTKMVLQQRQKLNDSMQRLERQIKDVEKKHEALEKQQTTLKKLREAMEENKNTDNSLCQANVPVLDKSKNQKDNISFSDVSAWLKCKWSKDQQRPKECNNSLDSENEENFVQQNEKIIGTGVDQEKETGEIIATEKEISKLEQDLKYADAEMAKIIDSCCKSIVQLRTCALKSDSDSTHQNILKLIDILKENNDTDKVLQLQAMLETAE